MSWRSFINLLWVYILSDHLTHCVSCPLSWLSRSVWLWISVRHSTVLALVPGFGAVKHLVDAAVDVCWQCCPLPLSQAFGLTQFYSRLEGAPMWGPQRRVCTHVRAAQGKSSDMQLVMEMTSPHRALPLATVGSPCSNNQQQHPGWTWPVQNQDSLPATRQSCSACFFSIRCKSLRDLI